MWTKIGAKTLAHAGVVEEMKRYEPKRWLESGKQRADVRDLKLPTVEQPKETFDKKPFILDDGNRR